MTVQAHSLGENFYVHKAQRGTGTCQWSNCNCTSHASFVRKEYLGAADADPAAIRSWIDSQLGVACAAGTNDVQNEKAIAALYPKVDLTHRFDVPWSTAADALDAFREVGAIERYSFWHHTTWDCSPNFNGNHKVRYLRRRWNGTTNRFEVLRSDPLADGISGLKGPRWVPESIARAATEALFSDHNCELEVTRSFAAAAPKKVLYVKDTKTGTVGKIRVQPDPLSAFKGSLGRGMTLKHSGTVPGKPWTINGWDGSLWLRVTAVNGAATTELYGLAQVYVGLGWVTGPTGAM